jgi:hypothetical protein
MSVLSNGQITVPNRFEEDFKNISLEKRERVIVILHEFMKEIRVLLQASEFRTRRATPQFAERCATCAFAECTDNFVGFPPTTYGLLLSFTRDLIFCCHGEHPNWKEQHPVDLQRPTLCHGFASVRLYSSAQATLLAVNTMKKIREIVPTAGKK